MRKLVLLLLFCLFTIAYGCNDGSDSTNSDGDENTTDGDSSTDEYSYNIVDTNQKSCFSDSTMINCPSKDSDFFGQDAQYEGNAPSYTISNDKLTVTDNVTGLMWVKSPDWTNDGKINIDDKMTQTDAAGYVATVNDQSFAGYNDWRLPSIKELYSLIDFTGEDISDITDLGADLKPYINSDVFDYAMGDTDAGERDIDSQWATSSIYTATVMNNQQCMFGVNFADGRIKCYPVNKDFYVLYVRKVDNYGENDFKDNGDDTISDLATGLMWAKNDSQAALNWEEALNFVAEKNEAKFLGYSDWRLPNIKELQSIVDYENSPDHNDKAAIDSAFNISKITNEAGESDYPYFWSSTTHKSYGGDGHGGAYITFGRALGYMNGEWMDVHGAGAQRSEDKAGSPDNYPEGHGPQGDAVRIYNYVRLVRNGATFTEDTESVSTDGDVTDGDTTNECSLDCTVAGNCPPDAPLGCMCVLNLENEEICAPVCDSDSDCPTGGPDELVCEPNMGHCVPKQ